MFRFSKSHSINFAKLHNLAENLLNDIPFVKRRHRRRRLFKFFRYFSYAILTIFLLSVIFLSANLLTIKQIYNQATDGKVNLEQAINYAKQENFKLAQVFAVMAKDNFDFAITNLNQYEKNFLIDRSLFLQQQFNQVEYLLTSGKFLSQAISQTTAIGQKFSNLLSGDGARVFSSLTKEEKELSLNRIFEATPELNGIKANLELALINLGQVNLRGILWPLKNEVALQINQLDQNIKLLDKIIPSTQILPTLLGYPEKANYLFILQDNDRLRPGGGLIGTYGLVEIADGDIVRFDTYDISHLDLPVKDRMNILPPEPLKRYLKVDKWLMRDANWSADWPTSAIRIQWFFQLENSLQTRPEKVEEFNGVIAMTPEFITDLLAVTGPIKINNREYNQDNFKDLLQDKIDQGLKQSVLPLWQNKEEIGQIIKELKIKIFDSPPTSWNQIFNLIDNNIREKNILVYLTDSQAQTLVEQSGLAGEMKNTVEDYLMVVDADLAGAKTKAVINKSINYQLEQSHNGLFAKLRIAYAHPSNLNDEIASYQNYTRVYVPLGSQLIKAEGLTQGQVDETNESGKTCFGVFMAIEPGKIGNLYFEYKLPYQLNQSIKQNPYELLIQKQPGNNINELTVDLRFINTVKSYNPTGFNVERQNSQIKWQTDLNIDREFEVKF